LAYKTKFHCKKVLDADFAVMPLQGQWWMEDMRQFTVADKHRWLWTIFIVLPDFVDEAILEEARSIVAKKKDPPSRVGDIVFDTLDEGHAAQVLHVGPYTEEAPTIAGLHAFIDAQGGRYDGLVQKHHEIYLSDMRRTAPEKLKTIIRQPFTA
jgi:hypothetical protein